MSSFNTAVFIDHVLGQIASFNNIVALKYTTGYFADPASSDAEVRFSPVLR